MPDEQRLRECPFCGGMEFSFPAGGEGVFCNKCESDAYLTVWNHRPLEDQLRAKLAAAEELIQASFQMLYLSAPRDDVEFDKWVHYREVFGKAKAAWEALK